MPAASSRPGRPRSFRFLLGCLPPGRPDPAGFLPHRFVPARSHSARPVLRARSALPALLVLCLTGCGGGTRELTLTVRDEENVVVPGVEVRQVGSEALLGTTDAKGLAAIEVAPRRGEALRLRLTSPRGQAGALYAFSDPEGIVQVSEQDLNAGYLRVRARRATPDGSGAGGSEGGGTPGAPGSEASLAIASQPPGARVTVAGEDRGLTPVTISGLPPGRTVVELRLDGYHSWARELVLFPGENADSAILHRSEVTTASLSVDSDPPGASIELDGRPMGRTPSVLRDVPIGRHRVRLSLEGHEPFSSSIVLSPGEESAVHGLLRRPSISEGPTRTPGSGANSPGGSDRSGGSSEPSGSGRGDRPSDAGGKITYSVSLRRGWAEVFVDDETVNRNITGVFSISLAPGTHRFRVRNEAAGVDVILQYEVRSGDRAKALLLDVDRKKVVPRTE